jgi:hypothetical protein
MSARDVADRLRKRRVMAEVDTTEGKLFVRALSGRERTEYLVWIEAASDQPLSKVSLTDHRLLCMALCDESGAPLFENEESGMEVLAEWIHEDITNAAKKVLVLSGLGKEATEAAEKK